MHKAEWSCAVEVVGGAILETVIKSIKPYGAVAVCGLVGSPEFRATVFPFILRGIRLLGIESAQYPMAQRKEVWENLAGPWKLTFPEESIKEVGLDLLDQEIEKILKGETRGQVLINLSA
jgi:NADPH:quinone reductase-like Zn-dependent oxidoreductase